MKSNTVLSENRFISSLSTSSIRNLLPRSMSSKHKSNSVNPKNPKLNIENTPPIDPNIQITDSQVSPPVPKQLPPKLLKSQHETAGSDSQHQVLSPPDLPNEEEIIQSDGQCKVSVPSDPAVKVVVRIKPMTDHERDGNRTVRKISWDSLSVGDRKFTFDSVLDSNSNQEDIFQLVGVPSVKNALAGYNTSILSYGQTGSGKTYTMWGLPSAMMEDPSPRSHQGIAPRLFQILFSEIQREQENSEGKQINYQCRCSFLEIYNEQIGDLIDSTQRNLEIKDDPKNGLYVENLTEEYVTGYEDIMQILIKGLSNRKVGATSINSKSSRSNIVFSCVIESWCKGTSSKCFNSSKTSRITLVDTAGMDGNKLDDAGRQFLREDKNVKKSLSQLGHLVNALAKGSQSKNSEDIPYRGSCLTHLLQESLGGNAKLTVICTISPDNKNNGEVLSTVRFGQRVRCIRNAPIINEITEDDVNNLSDQIRQLKEELIRANSGVCNLVGRKNDYFQERNARESLNQLRVSLNRSLILPPIDNGSEDEGNADMDDVKELHQQLEKLHNSWEENSRDPSDNRDSIQFYSVEASRETDLMSEDDINFPEETETEEVNSGKPHEEVPNKEDVASANNFIVNPNISEAIDPPSRSSISINPCHQSSFLQDPTLSESPKIGNTQRKSMAISSSLLASQNSVSESFKFKSDMLRQSLKPSEQIRSSFQSSEKIFPGATDSLAASLQRGLEIIDYHQQNSTSKKSSTAFSFENLTLKPCPEVDEANASIHTLPEEKPSLEGQSASFYCAYCQQKTIDNASNKRRDEGNDTSKAIKREEELENICMEQAAKIDQLNRLVEQYKPKGEYNSVTEYDQESNTYSLEASKKEIVPTEGLRNEEHQSLEDEDKLLKCSFVENHQPENRNENCEIKKILEESDIKYGETLNMNEKEALLKEIQSLRSKLQSYTDAPPKMSTEKLRSSLLSRSIQLRKSVVDPRHSGEEELERERQRWMEMESDWISLTDELRIDLESNCDLTEKLAVELKLEKRCTEELDDALHRAVLGHARIVEHYAELQENYNDLVAKHRAIMEGVAVVKRAAAKAGTKGHGSRFAKGLAAELCALRVEKGRERKFLKKENASLKIQLRDTAEAVHAAGELLARLREAEHAASVTEVNLTKVQEDNEKLKKQMEKLKQKHKMEMITMKQYLAESKLPESALQKLYREDSDIAHNPRIPSEDDQAWRAEFGAIYQEHN